MPPTDRHPHPLLASRPLEQLTASQPCPALLRREPMVEAQKIKEITGPPPGVTIPVRIVTPKHLKAGTHIPPLMMLFEGAGADAAPIEGHEPPNDGVNVLCQASGTNRPTRRVS